MFWPTWPRCTSCSFPGEAKERIATAARKGAAAAHEGRSFQLALELLHELPHPDPKLIAECREGLGELEVAAAEYLRAGRPADALRCYRGIPDFEKTLELLGKLAIIPRKRLSNG